MNDNNDIAYAKNNTFAFKYRQLRHKKDHAYHINNNQTT